MLVPGSGTIRRPSPDLRGRKTPGRTGGAPVPPPGPPCTSEVELQRQLDDARRADGVRDHAECVRHRDVARRRAEARVIQRVERLDPELGVARAADVERASRARGRGWCSPARARRRPGNCRTCRAAPAENALMSSHVSRCDWSRARLTQDRRRSSAARRRARPAASGARPSVTVIGRPVRAWKMPPTLQPPRSASVDAGPVAAPRAALAERQLVGGREARSCAGRRGTPVPTRPRGRRCSASRRLRWRSSRPAVPCRRTRRRSRGCWSWPCRACTTPGTRAPFHVALAHARLHRVVLAARPRAAVVAIVVTSGCAPIERPARRLGRPGRGVADAGQRLVALDRRHQVVGVMADVADLRRHRRGQPVLREHVPLLGELRPQVRDRRRARCPLGVVPGTRPAKPVADRARRRSSGRS